MSRRFALSLCAVLALLSARAAVFADDVVWTPIFKGIDLTAFEEREPERKIVAARIDLTAPGVALKTTERNPNFAPDERETVRETTPAFLERNDLALAVNGNFYAPFGNRTITKPGDANLRGLAVADGVVVSKPEKGFPSFVVKKDGTLEIRQYGADEDLSDAWIAVSGSAVALRDGKVATHKNKDVHPRTAIGFSEDQKYVYLMTIDGRRPGYSVGATLEDVGAALLKVGAHEGLNLDGGGSTTMTARAASGKPAILNWPINAISPDGLRFNGNAIGATADGAPLTSFDKVVEIHNTGEPVEWTPAYEGIDVASWIEYDDPLQRIFAARLDMKAPGVALKTSEPNKNFEPETRETWRQTTPEYLLDSGVKIAVNANFYTPFNADTIGNPGDSNVCGLAVCDGFVESQPQKGFPSFLVKKNGDLEIRDVAPDEDLSEIAQAVSGNRVILKNGEFVADSDKAIHPRTAIGYSQDKRYVNLVVIDGRQEGYSVGARYADVAKALKMCGAYDGLNLDGGGSTTMVVLDSDGEPVVLNRPCNATADKLRFNGNAIGATGTGELRTELKDGRAKGGERKFNLEKVGTGRRVADAVAAGAKVLAPGETSVKSRLTEAISAGRAVFAPKEETSASEGAKP